MLQEIRNSLVMDVHDVKLIHTCMPCSAAKNRNIALSKTNDYEFVIMMDDDITGFTLGWELTMIQPLIEHAISPETYKEVALVSARLMRIDGKPAHMMGDNYDMSKQYVEVESRLLPTACIAFVKHPDIEFDEQFIGSGFEDDDFCKQLQALYPNGKFIINNNVCVVHTNEMKNQKGPFWEYNKSYYLQKWPSEENRWH